MGGFGRRGDHYLVRAAADLGSKRDVYLRGLGCSPPQLDKGEDSAPLRMGRVARYDARYRDRNVRVDDRNCGAPSAG